MLQSLKRVALYSLVAAAFAVLVACRSTPESPATSLSDPTEPPISDDTEQPAPEEIVSTPVPDESVPPQALEFFGQSRTLDTIMSQGTFQDRESNLFVTRAYMASELPAPVNRVDGSPYEFNHVVLADAYFRSDAGTPFAVTVLFMAELSDGTQIRPREATVQNYYEGEIEDLSEWLNGMLFADGSQLVLHTLLSVSEDAVCYVETECDFYRGFLRAFPQEELAENGNQPPVTPFMMLSTTVPAR